MKADIKILANLCLILPFAVRIRQLVRAPVSPAVLRLEAAAVHDLAKFL